MVGNILVLAVHIHFHFPLYRKLPASLPGGLLKVRVLTCIWMYTTYIAVSCSEVKNKLFITSNLKYVEEHNFKWYEIVLFSSTFPNCLWQSQASENRTLKKTRRIQTTSALSAFLCELEWWGSVWINAGLFSPCSITGPATALIHRVISCMPRTNLSNLWTGKPEDF